ncbi:MAG TPA: CYTH and CHAD domain-containing protein [Actinomycetota bacterium]|nr:CYTH and CHAD domain-containing protein [Actinomycetota bacterium]
MRLEREAKLSVEPGFRLRDAASAQLSFREEPEDAQRFVSIYHDTEDLRLVRWGASFRYRAAEGWTVKLPRSVKGSVIERQEHVFEGGPSRAPADAVDLVRGFVRGGILGPVARLRTVRRRTKVVRLPDERMVAEIVDDDVSVLDGRRTVGRFREVEAELCDPVESSMLEPVLGVLIEGGARAADPVPKVVRALGDRASAPPDVVVPSIGPSSSVEDVVRATLATSTIRLITHDADVRVGTDPEGVHQVRVATRRLRSDLRTFRSLLVRGWHDALRSELGWLGGELGPVRDLDVLGERLRKSALLLPDDDAANVATVLDRLRVRRDAVRVELLSAMRASRYVELLDALVDAAAAPRVLREVAGAPAVEVMGAVMQEPWNRLAAVCEGLGPHSTDAELHEARIRSKRVRYAAEALTPVFGRPARRFARRAEALQQVLGTHQDAVMAIAWLREQAGGVTPRVAFTSGRLAGFDAGAREDARRAWPAAWADLQRRGLRFWE